ncbi:DUF58 domain-containing protein [Calycomorphotria hydatis]|uniref:DUF58 domain-containing protein n=1 Tax=Calycomorphotria hydatis TaxID=2528027 RepID=A0A517T877_9PLAN|nr:DUF58 domain-containing protein [Calycomorphotria hydatis]QDT64557.1 hypothetical protein V22_17920 [Calycomorphotria hydatis]
MSSIIDSSSPRQGNVERYLKPEVIETVSRLDLRARFIVEGFLAGLHTSPFHGFSVEFSEHRRYSTGDDPKDIDWLVYAKTDRYYVKKYQAETNITGYLLLDLSASMGYTYRQQLTKFEYSVCLAAALSYLMITQQDPVGAMTFDQQIRDSLPARSKRTQLGNLLALLSRAEPAGETDVAANLKRIASMVKHRSLMMIFSDLLTPSEGVIEGIRRLRYAGHDVILFHTLDEAEVRFPFDGFVDLKDPETGNSVVIDAVGMRGDYLETLEAMRNEYRQACLSIGADYVPLDTSMAFDRALIEYLSRRQARF